MSSTYTPGLHLILDGSSANVNLLCDLDVWKVFVTGLIDSLGLKMVGAAYHRFEGLGFTGTICLTESHLAIHTWPEYGHFTFDVFLSNYEQVNDGKGRRIVEAMEDYFKSKRVQFHAIKR